MKQIHLFGDHLDTDRIIPGKYTKTLDLKVLADHCFEDIAPNFAQTVQTGDIVVAGHNFGCGSSREQAPIAIRESGVSMVIARSFARIFFRNAINVGLLVLEVPDHSIHQDSKLEYRGHEGVLFDHKQDKSYQLSPLPKFLQDIVSAGGLVPYLSGADGYDIQFEGGQA